ncbi:hypothetical protein C8F04DRAFT_1087064 [Mycena alexandri]|uniref:BHLH domain-containing protein n=1 Tax=Mycena alexandri TaxID=1745969 RepID=A0AAD6T3J6_9AGAR|nr:hypothetical protein C8F04DRAFT_1087064 [Mycena alexandri]
MAGIYAASTNPPRTARHRPRSQSASSSASEYIPEPRRIVPLSPKLSKAGTDRTDAEPSTSTAKRGRKPATMSRTAREAQRKLNHSIIEKARRTKINDALATLKQLVPPNYGQQPVAPAEQDDDEADGDYGGTKPPKKTTGKRDEKEKEFKLEILVRTVSFMQDLIDRVAVLEAAARPSSSCRHCGETNTSSALKRKRSVGAGDEQQNSGSGAKRRETELATPEPSPSLRPEASPSIPPSTYDGERLPSISSWLPETGMRPSPRLSPQFQSHLPSPPSSTQFTAHAPPSQLPPALSLGPIATQSLLSARTPEDESAASLLLEISASSPTFREAPRQVQTPASLLGLVGKK